jgi:hypothetical protein
MPLKCAHFAAKTAPAVCEPLRCPRLGTARVASRGRARRVGAAVMDSLDGFADASSRATGYKDLASSRSLAVSDGSDKVV